METSHQIFTRNMYRTFVKVACCISFLIGLSVLIGWQFDIPSLKSILPNYITMKANTAVGLILLSIALYLTRSPKQSARSKAVAVSCLCLTSGIAVTTLGEYYFNKNFGLDELLFVDSMGHAGKFPPGRLAPITALIFLMLSSGAMLLDATNEKLTRGAHFLFFTSFLCAFQALVAYFCGVTYAFGSAFYTQMAVHTALGTGLLALGFLAARPGKGFMIVLTADTIGGYMARRLIALGTLAPPAINFLERTAHRSGLFEADFGVLVRVIGNVVLFVIIAWRISATLHEADIKQKHTDKLNRDLKDTVLAQHVAKELNAAMENALDGIAKLSAAGRILMVNRAMIKIFGEEHSDLLGKSWLQIADESEMSVLNAMKDEMLRSGRAEAEVLGMSQGANKVYLHIVLVQVNSNRDNHGAAYLFAKDISVRKRDQAALTASRAQLAEAQQIAQIGSWSIDPKDNSITVSDEFFRIYGLKPEPSNAKRSIFQAAVHPDDRELAVAKANSMNAAGDSYRADFRIIRPNGEIRYVHSRGRAILDSQGRSDKLVGTLQDVTELRVVENELIAAREAALESSRLKSAFLANMSHEIRTPINGVIGMTGLLIDTKLDSEQKDYVDAISRSAGALLVIINDILDVSKIEAGKLEIETVDFDLDEIISDVGKVASMEAKRKGLSFKVKSVGDLEHLLRGDPGRIRQVLMNLLSNAIKFTVSGSVELRVEQIVCDETESIQIRFLVLDSGIGIEQEAFGKLFQPFTQADSSTTRRFGGTGLGLSICKQLVELMHGTIGATSIPDQGSTFWFTLPFKLGVIRRIPPTYQAQSYASKELAGKRILIAEDNFINQKVAFGLIEKLGCKPHCVANGFEAISALHEFTFDLILMDCQMPELDGFGATAKIRASGTKWAEIPIIAMTANVVKGDRERCLESGMNDYISKPVKIADLSVMLNKWLNTGDEAATPRGIDPDSELPTLDTRIIDEIRSFSDSTNDSVISDLFHSFLATTPKILQHLSDSCEVGQIKKLKFEAHSLKSAAGTLGAAKFSEICQKLEDSTEATGQNVLRALIREANAEFTKASKEMKEFLDRPSAA